MADELDGLLGRVEDPALRADLRAHIDRLRAKRTFGLVFESHLPERVRLPEHPVRAGAKVALRDDRGQRDLPGGERPQGHGDAPEGPAPGRLEALGR